MGDGIFDTISGKIIAGVLSAILVAIGGNGLLMWRNASVQGQALTEIREDIHIVQEVRGQVGKIVTILDNLESRVSSLEKDNRMAMDDRLNRGGSFRRDDADKMESEILARVNDNDKRVSKNEVLAQNLQQQLNECRATRATLATKSEVDKLEATVRDIINDHKSWKNNRNSLEEKCDRILEFLGD